MAVVVSHVHFCPSCDELWKCVQWFCGQEEWDELLCKACHEGIEVPERGCAVMERGRSNLAESCAGWHPCIPEMGKELLPSHLGNSKSRLKGLRRVGLNAGSVDKFPD